MKYDRLDRIGLVDTSQNLRLLTLPVTVFPRKPLSTGRLLSHSFYILLVDYVNIHLFNTSTFWFPVVTSMEGSKFSGVLFIIQMT